ncbi:MAG: DsbE family thiol:disulfide interchange protein [Lautropia sp.]|nr:DsbE family thiol:disulfide interchange protein [Lautropia sp.]
MTKTRARKAAFSFPLRYLLPAIFFLVLAVFLLLGLGHNPREIPSPLIGRMAPDFHLPRLTLPSTPASSPGPATADTQTGQPATIHSQALRGRPYLLNVWASWCVPCLQEHPQIMALAQSHRIRMIGMNYKDQASEARRWLERNGNPYEMVLVDAQGHAGIDFGVYGVPETFLVDAEGRIRYKMTGALSIQTLQDSLLPAIAALTGDVTSGTTPGSAP